MIETEWRESPDGSWWFMGPDNRWHPSDVGPDEIEAQPAVASTSAAESSMDQASSQVASNPAAGVQTTTGSSTDSGSAMRREPPGSAASTLPKAPPLSSEPGPRMSSQPSTGSANGAGAASSTASSLPTGAWLAIISGVLAVVASFLPWVHFSAVFVSVDRNGFQLGQGESFSAAGLIVLLLGVVTAVIGIAKLTSSATPRYMQRSSIVTGIAIIVVAAGEISPIHGLINNVESASSAATGSVGFGLWLAIVSGALAVVAGAVLRSSLP